MIRNLKALGLSLVALLAIGALSASSASAVDIFTVSGGGSALVTGVTHNGQFKFYPTGSSFECTTAKFAATVHNGASQITVDAAYEGILNETPHTNHSCTAKPSGTFTVDMNGCDYDFSGDTNAGLYTNDIVKDAPVWVTCPAGKEITITHSLGVQLHIPPQTPTKGGVTYQNAANGDVKVTATMTGTTITCTPTFACTLGGIPHHSNATEYTGDVTLAGFEDKNATGTITPASEGAAVNITTS